MADAQIPPKQIGPVSGQLFKVRTRDLVFRVQAVTVRSEAVIFAGRGRSSPVGLACRPPLSDRADLSCGKFGVDQESERI